MNIVPNLLKSFGFLIDISIDISKNWNICKNITFWNWMGERKWETYSRNILKCNITLFSYVLFSRIHTRYYETTEHRMFSYCQRHFRFVSYKLRLHCQLKTKKNVNTFYSFHYKEQCQSHYHFECRSRNFKPNLCANW